MLKYEAIDNDKKDWAVFVHGLGGSAKTWGKQIELFSQRYNLLFIDLPGHGQDAKRNIKHVNPQMLYQGIINTLDYLHISNAYFIGLSLGTIVVANFAIEHPDRVKGIVMGGSVLWIGFFYRFFVWLANVIKYIIPHRWLYVLFAYFMMPAKNHAKSRKIFLREALKLNRDSMCAWIEYIAEYIHPSNLVAQLNALNKKMLFISGDEDHCFINGSKRLVKKLNTAKLKIIEHCGHVCSIEQAKVFNAWTLDYLTQSF